MKKHRILGLCSFSFVCILSMINADGNFEDADKLSDLSGTNTEQHFDLRHTIPGIPEIDYPIYSRVPKTSFECTGRHEGYYADIESRCQAFRICTHTARSKQGFGFLCPNGTLFSQRFFVCDWYRNVDCDDSENFYSKNDINRVGSSFDMMETVRQMMEYPMKTISKALQQNPGSSRKPTQINRGTGRKANNSDDSNKESESPRNRGRVGSSRKSVTRDQVESAHNRGTLKFNREKETYNRDRDDIADNKGNVAAVKINDEKATNVGGSVNAGLNEEVYVNSLGELSTDPGVTFDRTNAHIIAEPRRYRYEKYNMNFAEKVNAGLHDLSDLASSESLAPDYVKSLRNIDSETPNTDLPSKINQLLDEIAYDLPPNTSANQDRKPTKTKHSFRFLSRGFSSQDDPYKYNKPKQTASTIRFTPNQLPNDEEHISKKPTIDVTNDAVSSKHSTEVQETPESTLEYGRGTDYKQPPKELQTFEEAPYLIPPDRDISIESTTSPVATYNETSNPEAEHESNSITSSESSNHAELSLVQSSETLNTEESTSLPDITQNVIATHQQEHLQKIDSTDTPIDEDRIDVNKQAENLFISGLQLTNNEDNTEVTTAANVAAHTPLLIQVAEDHSYLTAWITSTSSPATEAAPTTNPETQTETGSIQDRIRNYRRLANLQRASAKPMIYGKRAGLRMTKMATTTTTTPKPSSTTRSYLKRVAASRLRLSRLAAAAGNKPNLASNLASNPSLSPVENEIDASRNKKLSIRNIDKDTVNGGNNIDEPTKAKNSGIVTWESVKSSLERFQVKPKIENDVSTTVVPPKINSTISNSAASRNSLLRKRNRLNNIKSQQLKINENDNRETTKDSPLGVSTSMTMSISSSSASPALPLSSTTGHGKLLPLSFLNTIPHHVTPSSSPIQSMLSFKSTSTQNDITSSTSISSTPFFNGASADNPNSNSKSASAPNNIISFDELRRSIADDSILQNYRAGPILGRTSVVSTVNGYQPSEPPSSSQNAFSQVNPLPFNQNPQINFNKAPGTASLQVQLSHQPAFGTPIISTTIRPPIVVARAEGQRLVPNNISSIISSLITPQKNTQTNPTTTPPTSLSYVPLNDFLSTKFGNQPTNNKNLSTTNYVSSQYEQQQQLQPQQLQQQQPQQQQHQQQQQQQQHQQQQQQHQNSISHQQQYYQQTPQQQQLSQDINQISQQQPLQQQLQINQEQYQQPTATPAQSYQQNPQQIQTQQQFLPNPQQQNQLSLSFQQQQQQQQRQQQTHNNYQSASAPIALQSNYLQQNQPQTHIIVPPSPTFQPPVAQNYFVHFKQQQQQQLPVFPPLANQFIAPAKSLQQFDGNSNFLNVQLPAVANSLIPAPINQIAQRRKDITIDNLKLADFAPSQSIFFGATSYDVPLKSIGRLSNDTQALSRLLRKF